jgi:hypothetical protein
MGHAPSMARSEIMASNIDEWCRRVWPHLKLSDRTVLQVGLSRLEKGYELVVPTQYPEPWYGIAPNTQMVYHGANPMSLHLMLPNNLLPSIGKEGYVGVWTSSIERTAFGYPMCMPVTEGVPITADGPYIRVLLEVSLPSTSIIKRWRGKKRWDGVVTNSQICARPGALQIERVRLICTRRKGSPDMDGTQAGLSRRRKFDMYVEKAEKMYMKCPLITALRRRLWGVRSRRQPLQSPVTAGLIHAERL